MFVFPFETFLNCLSVIYNYPPIAGKVADKNALKYLLKYNFYYEFNSLTRLV